MVSWGQFYQGCQCVAGLASGEGGLWWGQSSVWMVFIRASLGLVLNGSAVVLLSFLATIKCFSSCYSFGVFTLLFLLLLCYCCWSVSVFVTATQWSWAKLWKMDFTLSGCLQSSQSTWVGYRTEHDYFKHNVCIRFSTTWICKKPIK